MLHYTWLTVGLYVVLGMLHDATALHSLLQVDLGGIPVHIVTGDIGEGESSLFRLFVRGGGYVARDRPLRFAGSMEQARLEWTSLYT